MPETEWPYDWLMGWRDVCRAADERTVIASVGPRTAVGHTAPLLLPVDRTLPLEGLLANLCAFVLDFAARQKIPGAHLTYAYLEQLPVLGPHKYAAPTPWLAGEPLAAWIRPRVLELTYTSHELAPFARHLGDEEPPFVWDDERRFLMRAELDAAYFHLYGLSEAEVALVPDSFRAFRNKKAELFARTREEILTVYRAMAKAAESGGRYAHPELTPAPGLGQRHEPGRSPLTRLPVKADEEAAGEQPPQSEAPEPGSPEGEDPDGQLGFWD